ncbi:hypothetical protein HID58_007708 [Brassica napus]|uniref:Uncharacterized protein n=1 Tax=Brassica napus TaxID=3708 RepID=A0ABQ7WY46_BRANA|nr:hypothetical protein HID58_091948 [Brassica napus]KAH0940247.1 hypothetical protein HID58_007708 [Brassica napus]
MLCFSVIFTMLCFSVQEMLCFRSFENAAGLSLCIPMDATDDTLGPKSLVKTSEFIRLIIDALTSLGFNAIATDIDALKPLELADENTVILLLLEQKYLDSLKNEQVPEALNTIREEIQPLGLDLRLLHKLASKILKPDPVGEEETARAASSWSCSPGEKAGVLSEHTDEVWFLTFSHDGKCLASSSKDKTAILWEMDADGKFTQKHKLVGHEKPVVAVLWSHDDQQVITCGENEVIKRWDVVDVGSVSCGWLHDGSGRETRAERVIQLHEKEMITSFSLSRDNKYLLIDLVTQEIQLWVIGGDEPFYLSEYDGHKRTRFIIRSCFGGYDEDFVASGSEDSQVYIWHVAKGLRPCRVLRGHSGAVNCVSWNPTDIHMLASGSDDRTIRIWGLAKK